MNPEFSRTSLRPGSIATSSSAGAMPPTSCRWQLRASLPGWWQAEQESLLMPDRWRIGCRILSRIFKGRFSSAEAQTDAELVPHRTAGSPPPVVRRSAGLKSPRLGRPDASEPGRSLAQAWATAAELAVASSASTFQAESPLVALHPTIGGAKTVAPACTGRRGLETAHPVRCPGPAPP
jgi:hypothetical protein